MLLEHKVGCPFMTNVLRIALNNREETIASVLVAFYCVQIDDSMIIRAIKTAQMNFLDMVFAFNKNFERIKTWQPRPGEVESSDSEDERIVLYDSMKRAARVDRYLRKYRTITLNYIIKSVISLWPDDYKKIVGLIAGWNLK